MPNKTVVMNLKEYLKEHKRLINLLKSAHKPAFTKEANEQIREVKKTLRKLKLKRT
jgi:hypothetical protein